AGARVHADLVVDDEFQPREADAGVRKLGELEGELRVAHVHGDLDRDARHVAAAAARDLERNEALVDVPGVALGARDADLLAVLQAPGRFAAAHHGRNAELARDDRGMAGAAAAVVTIAAATFITGSQLGSVMSVTRMSPSFTLDICEALATTRTV